jgi:two-component sensor histidine kinase/CHASE1-domain containing sensor protein
MRPFPWADRLMGLLTRFVGLVILLATIIAAVGSFVFNQNLEVAQASRLATQIDVRLRDQQAVLESVRAFYQSSPTASGPAIRTFLSNLKPEVRAPGMEGIGIAIAMQHATPSAAEDLLLENYGRTIPIWPTSDQSVGFPIVLIEPENERNIKALGFDMFSNPARREAMQRAWRSGSPAASKIVELVQEGSEAKQPGFLIYLPLYERTNNSINDTSPDDLPTAHNAQSRPIEGFVFAPFRTHDLMEAVIGSQLSAIKGIEVRAGTQTNSPLVYTHGSMHWSGHNELIHVADQTWSIRVSYGRFTGRLARPLSILIFGLALALVAAQLHDMQRRRIGDLHDIAEERARHAEDRELMLGEMAHRMKNAFARIGALARITLHESKDLAEFEQQFDGRLRALSNAKQLLVAGTVDTVELGAIVRRELQLAGWPDDKVDAITGPEIALDEETAQSIALAVHELATNSVKYGALSGKGDLHVEWARADGKITLNWIENGLKATPMFDQENFGSHFIRSLIERQLKGGWTRTAGDHSLTIHIHWPHPTP